MLPRPPKTPESLEATRVSSVHNEKWAVAATDPAQHVCAMGKNVFDVSSQNHTHLRDGGAETLGWVVSPSN